MVFFTSNQEKQWQIHRNKMADINTTLELDGSEGCEWEGWGGCFNELSQKALMTLTDVNRSQVYDLLFAKEEDGLRLEFCRLPIGASDYSEIWYSHDEHDGDFGMAHFSIKRDKRYLIPYITEALRRNPDMKLFASPWSPPTWMKFPAVFNHGTLEWTEHNLNAYALYFVKFINEYKKENIEINQIHIQNEPMSDQKFPSCKWTGEQMAEFIGKHLGPAFKKHDIKAKIWLGTLNGAPIDEQISDISNNFANIALHDKDAYKYIEGVSYQWAGKNALPSVRASFPEKKYLQSENECGDGKNTWSYMNYIFGLYRHYITNGVCAYMYWNMVLSPKGKSSWGWEQNSMITADGEYTLNYEYYLMKHFSRYVRKGSKSLGLSGHFSGNSVAFKNTDGNIILITQNPFNYEITFKFNGQVITLPKNSINTIIF